MNLKTELRLTTPQARAALGAARAIVEAEGPASERGAQLLAAVGSTLELDWRATPTATPAELAAAFPDDGARVPLADALILPACIEGQVTLAGERAAQAFAEALGVRSKWVELLPSLRKRRVLAVKRALFSSSPDGQRILRRTWSEDGLRGLVSVVVFLLGLHRDAALAARFRALGTLPLGSFGRGFHDDFVARGLTFPGERGGLPERMIHHDLMHVINGYSTEPAGECELAGFYAGFCSRFQMSGWFTFFVTVLATFQFGMPVSPAIVTPARGAFDPEKVLAAFLRGRRLRIDVMGPWDYWALMPLTLDEARARLGIGDAQPTESLQSPAA